MKIKYSFIVPVYGCEKYLESCVESILAQKGDHVLEVLLVDDGSKDGSGRIADALAARDSRVRTFHKENGGAASARNYGIGQAIGEYVLFVDSDDTVDDQLLNHVDEAVLEKPEVPIVFGMSFDYYRNEKLYRTEKLSCKHEGYLTINEILNACGEHFHDNSLSSACNKVFSLAKIRQHGLIFEPKLSLYEDFVFTTNYLEFVNGAVFIPKCFYHYRICEEKNQYTTRISNLEDVAYMLSKMRKSMHYFDSSCSLEIRYEILQQILRETLLACCFRINTFCLKLSEFNSCLEIRHIYNEFEQETKAPPMFLSLILSKKYTYLWCKLFRIKIRRRLVCFIKCGGYYVLLLKKSFLESIKKTTTQNYS